MRCRPCRKSIPRLDQSSLSCSSIRPKDSRDIWVKSVLNKRQLWLIFSHCPWFTLNVKLYLSQNAFIYWLCILICLIQAIEEVSTIPVWPWPYLNSEVAASKHAPCLSLNILSSPWNIEEILWVFFGHLNVLVVSSVITGKFIIKMFNKPNWMTVGFLYTVLLLFHVSCIR